MANIYDINSAIQQPNIVGNFNAGVQTGQQNQVFQEKQDAYQQALQNQQNISALAPKIIAGDPTATDQAAAIDPTQAATYTDAANQHLRRISGAISYIDQQSTPQGKEAAYQQVKPYLAQFGQQPPATFAEAAPKMEQARAQIATMQQQTADKLINVGAGGAIFDPNTKQAIYTNPGVAPKPQLIQTADGSYAWATPGGSASPVTYAGGAQASQAQPQFSTQITPSSPTNSGAAAQANALLAKGMQPEQIMQQVISANPGQKVALSIDPASGQFADAIPDAVANAAPTDTGAVAGGVVKAPAKAGAASFRTASPDEIKAMGLAPGTVAQIDNKTNKVDIVSKPDSNANNIVAPGDPTKTGEEYLSTIPASMRNTVRAMAHGDQAPPSSSSRAPEAQALLQAIYQYDPTASASNLPTRTATRKSFTSGKDAQNMTALSQLALHLDHLNNQVDTVSGLPLPNFVNGAINSVEDKSNGKTTAFESSANAVAHELRAVFANAGGGTQAELEENLKQLNSSNSVAQKKAAVQNIAQLVHGRFGILQDKYTQGMGKTEDPFQTSYPGAESTILRLSGAGAEQAAPSAQSGWSISKVNP